MKTPKTSTVKAELYEWLHKSEFTPAQIEKISYVVDTICKTLLEESQEKIAFLIESIKTRV